MKKMILIAALLAVSLVSKAQLVGTGITKSFHRLSFNLFNEILKTEEGLSQVLIRSQKAL